MLKKSNIQNAILSVIAVGVISIVIQNQVIINQLSDQNNTTSFSRKVNNHSPNQNFVNLPVNTDGSINVNLNEILDVNIEQVGGRYTHGTVPVNAE